MFVSYNEPIVVWKWKKTLYLKTSKDVEGKLHQYTYSVIESS